MIGCLSVLIPCRRQVSFSISKSVKHKTTQPNLFVTIQNSLVLSHCVTLMCCKQIGWPRISPIALPPFGSPLCISKNRTKQPLCFIVICYPDASTNPITSFKSLRSTMILPFDFLSSHPTNNNSLQSFMFCFH